MNKKNFRTGAIGALMDEYERAAHDLITILEKLPADKFERIYDPKTSDEHCRSIKSIINHVVDAAYRYANQIRIFLAIVPVKTEFKIENTNDAVRAINKVLTFTANSIEGFWNLSDDQILATRQQTKWGLYDIEMMFEHAIVHILRHRRQIEKFLLQ
ncbi:MAG: DinB family protein [Melioribacter sp.]|nr:DinB family protein [Melioribacter sp.]